MSDQLKVDLQSLADLSIQMSALRAELDGTPSTFDEYAIDMGNVALSAATIGFGDDWSTFRLQLIADIDKLGVFADTAAKTYTGIEADLATQIENLLEPPPGPLQ